MLIQNVSHAVGQAVEATERVDYLLAKGQHGRKLGSDSRLAERARSTVDSLENALVAARACGNVS
jgi:hypothetical protein